MRIKFISRDITDVKDFCGLRIWEKPKETAVYAIGADIAEGVGQDASCAQVINTRTGLLAASYWHNLIDVDNFTATLTKLGYFYNRAYICIEANNHGIGVISLIGGGNGGLAYPNLYRRLTVDEYTQKRTKTIGFKTTSNTKPRIIENLKSALRDGEIVVHDKYTLQELGTFIRDERTGRLAAKGSAKDDRVMALALAWEQSRLLQESINTTDQRQARPMSYDPITGFPSFDIYTAESTFYL